MNYTQAVTEARRLVKRSETDQWRLAELTWEQVEGGKSRAQWARDIGISEKWAQTLYKVWEQWGAEDLPARPTFSEAYGKVAPNLSYEGVAEGHARRALADPERVREAVRSDPEIRRALVEDPETYAQLSEARIEHVVDQAGRTGGRAPGEEAEFRQHMGERFAEHRAQDALSPLYRLMESIAQLRVRFQPEEFAEQAGDRDIATLTKELPEDIAYLQAIVDAAQGARKPRLVERKSS